jgi:hypothetical protein
MMYVSANEKAVSLNVHRYTAEDIWRAIMSGAAVGLRCRHSRGVSDWSHVRPELDLWDAATPGGCQIGHMCDQNSTYGMPPLPGGVRLVTCATRTRLMGWDALTPGGCQSGYTDHTGCRMNCTVF